MIKFKSHHRRPGGILEGSTYWHDLRHSAASYWVLRITSLAPIAAVPGQMPLSMVKRYAYRSEAHTGVVLERMNRHGGK